MQTVILCGGKGTRLGPEDMPKPLFKVGSQPMLWHIMKVYENSGFNDFILLLGYKKEEVMNYAAGCHKTWHIKCLDTGPNTNTGGRLKKAEKLIKGDVFFATYGDGLAGINLKKLLTFHKKHGKVATLTSVRPYSQFGIMGIDSHTNTVTHFEEKPMLDHWVNGGFFVFNRGIFRYLKDNDVLERDTFWRLVKDKNLVAYKHKGFWECMDTYKDNLRLNELWNSGRAPWALWHKK
ncbi:MAG: sugar phosphate nucleotidyltransferase [Candidatus Omnitrophica bacterium]|nr:sugar phosphate nucleotidyltransferase [Candidatus Omnitrophota bacterium]